eukprot:TRINITY_DN5808_c0_g1_i2.p1 TRINITY_DN5808_c0_g1~~TRINITY_DN5808_c0_g1_i2.p1  ORF type:complete len:179 (-),score=26.00 TRINITY_DN5808_c0_g1_i2:51-587(-)
MRIINHSCGDQCTVVFKQSSWWDSASKQKQEVFGTIVDKHKKKTHKFRGKWSDALFLEDENGTISRKPIWQAIPPRTDHASQFGFTTFAIELNELTDELSAVLPPTDTRFRPDQRLFENGQFEQAAIEKERLESKQRRNPETRPLWFVQHRDTWLYKGGYFESRETGSWGEAQDRRLF